MRSGKDEVKDRQRCYDAWPVTIANHRYNLQLYNSSITGKKALHLPTSVARPNIIFRQLAKTAHGWQCITAGHNSVQRCIQDNACRLRFVENSSLAPVESAGMLVGRRQRIAWPTLITSCRRSPTKRWRAPRSRLLFCFPPSSACTAPPAFLIKYINLEECSGQEMLGAMTWSRVGACTAPPAFSINHINLEDCSGEEMLGAMTWSRIRRLTHKVGPALAGAEPGRLQRASMPLPAAQPSERRSARGAGTHRRWTGVQGGVLEGPQRGCCLGGCL